MKNKTQRRIYKISSKRFRLNKWDLKLNDSNTLPEEIVKIGDNQIFEFIRQIRGKSLDEENYEISNVKNEIRNRVNVVANIDRLNKLTFINDLCFVVIDSISDYNSLNNKMVLNDIEFKRLYATTGGVKNSTIIYVASDIHDELQSRIDNGRNMDIPFSAGKLEAYKSLSFTNSVAVSNPRKVVVVKDFFNKFIENEIIELDDSNSIRPTIEHKSNIEIELNGSDGFGIISMHYAEKISKELNLEYIPSGFLIRNSFLKGMCYRMDINKFANQIANTKTIIDIYGNEFNINEVDMIIPESVFKLWQSYNGIEDYLTNCHRNGYTFRVAKTTPKKLDNIRNLNYQFIQTLELSDSDIRKLSEYTVSQIKDIINNNYIKTLLYTKGIGLLESNVKKGIADYTKALMIEPKMINDPFVKSKVHNMLKRKITDAKIGVLGTSGNFQTIGGDIFAFLQHSFGLMPSGLLKSNQIYSKYWIDKNINEVAVFRAPMSSHNNIRKVEVVNSELIQYWFGHLDSCMLLNSYDTLTHALNGADYDGDSFYSTDSDVILNSIKNLPCVICKQKTAPKKVCTFNDFVTANINGFGDEIGSITNKITEMICKQSTFEKDSLEYKELDFRILCGQLYQQNAIDKIKSIESKPMPEEWYNFRSNIIDRDEDGKILKLDDFNVSILADKKPYFFIYNYQTLKKEYNKYVSSVNIKSMNLFGVKLSDLLKLDVKTNEIQEFVEMYYKKLPVDASPSVMNRICWHVESELDNIKIKNNSTFDHSILKTTTEYSKSSYQKVKKLYEDYKIESSKFTARKNEGHLTDEDYTIDREQFKLKFIKEVSQLEITDEDLANIVVDLCYSTSNSKQFAWDVAGEQILTNLLKKNSNKISFPKLDEVNGCIEFNGHRFSIVEMEVGDDFVYSN